MVIVAVVLAAGLADGVQHELSVAYRNGAGPRRRQPSRARRRRAGNRRPSSRTRPRCTGRPTPRAPSASHQRIKRAGRGMARAGRRARADANADLGAPPACARRRRRRARARQAPQAFEQGIRGVVMRWPFCRPAQFRASAPASPSASASAARARASRWRAASGRIASTLRRAIVDSPSTPTSSRISRCISGSDASARSRSTAPDRRGSARRGELGERAASGGGRGESRAGATRRNWLRATVKIQAARSLSGASRAACRAIASQSPAADPRRRRAGARAAAGTPKVACAKRA